jgi:hypothetical protein
MRIAVAAAALLLTSPVMAAGWTAGMIEDEGGPVMSASVSGEGGDVPPLLLMECTGEAGVMLRYSFGSGPGESVELPTDAFPFTFAFGNGQTATLSMQYEDMDGAYAAYFSSDEPVVAMLRSGKNLTVSDPTGVWHDQAFPMTGSSKAIAELLAGCASGGAGDTGD